jgi:hypothetical protein
LPATGHRVRERALVSDTLAARFICGLLTGNTSKTWLGR